MVGASPPQALATGAPGVGRTGRRTRWKWTPPAGTIVCICGVVYILSCSRWLLQPSLLAFVCIFLAGCVVSTILGVFFLIWLLYKATDTYDPIKERDARLAQLAAAAAAAAAAANPHSGPAGKAGPAARGGRGNRQGRGKPPLPPPVPTTLGGVVPIVVDGALQLGPGGELPQEAAVPLSTVRPQPPSSGAGTYAGVIWTVPASTWSPEQQAKEFPPPCEGPGAISHRWHASLASGQLSLRPAYGAAWQPTGVNARHPVPGGAPVLPPLVVVPLLGCEARLVTECLGSVNRPWGRRCALEVRLATAGGAGGSSTAGGAGGGTEEGGEAAAPQGRQLLYGEPSFYFFTESSHAKEQWLLALQAACGPPQQGAVIAAARATYAAMCTSLLAGVIGNKGMLPRLAAVVPTAGTGAVAGAAGLQGEGGDGAGSQSGRGRASRQRSTNSQQSLGQGAGGEQGKPKGGGAFGWVGRIFGRRGSHKQQQQQQPAQTPSSAKSEQQTATTAAVLLAGEVSVTGDGQAVGGSVGVLAGATTGNVSASSAGPDQATAVPDAPKQDAEAGPADGAGPKQDVAGTPADGAGPLASGDLSVAAAAFSEPGIQQQSSTQEQEQQQQPQPGPPSSQPSAQSTQPDAPSLTSTLWRRANSSSVPDLRVLGVSMDTAATILADGGGGGGGGAAKEQRAGELLGQEGRSTTEGGEVPRDGDGAGTGTGATETWGSPQRPVVARGGGRHSLDAGAGGLQARAGARDGSAGGVPLPGLPDNDEDEEEGTGAEEEEDEEGGRPKAGRGSAGGKGGGQGTSADGAAGAAAGTAGAAGGAGAGAGAGGPPRPTLGAAVDGLHGVNMLLVRLGYELLRASWFNNWLQGVLQNLLSKLKRPPYLQPLLVESLELGTGVPLIRAARAVAGPANVSPGGGLWPQLALELVYTGRASIMVSTKVELQKAGMFSTLQATLARLQGGGGGDGAGGCSPLCPQTPQGTPAGVSPVASSTNLTAMAGQPPPTTSSSSTGYHHAQSLPNMDNPAASSTSLESTPSNLGANHHHHQHSGSGGGGGGGFLGLGALTRSVAATAQHLTSSWVDSLSRMPVQLVIDITSFEGTLMLWMSPPPSDRLWISFLDPPRMSLSARPILGGRALRYGGPLLGRIGKLIQTKIIRALHREMVFPACSDIKVGFFASSATAHLQRPLDLPLDLITAMAVAAVGNPLSDLAMATLGADPATAAGTGATPRVSDAATAGRGGSGDTSHPGSAKPPLPHGGGSSNVSLDQAPSGKQNGGPHQSSAGNLTDPGAVPGAGGAAGGASGVVSGLQIALPRPGAAGADGGGGLPAQASGAATPLGSSESGALGGAGSGSGKAGGAGGPAGPHKRNLFLGFRWRPWGRRAPGAAAVAGSEADGAGPGAAVDGPPGLSRLGDGAGSGRGQGRPEGATPPQISRTPSGQGGSGLQRPPSGRSGQLAAAAAAAAAAGGGATPRGGSEDGRGGSAVSLPSLEGSVHSGQSFVQSPKAGEVRRGNSGGRAAANIAGQSLRGLAWLGGTVARGITRPRQRNPSSTSQTNSNQSNSQAHLTTQPSSSSALPLTLTPTPSLTTGDTALPLAEGLLPRAAAAAAAAAVATNGSSPRGETNDVRDDGSSVVHTPPGTEDAASGVGGGTGRGGAGGPRQHHGGGNWSPRSFQPSPSFFRSDPSAVVLRGGVVPDGGDGGTGGGGGGDSDSGRGGGGAGGGGLPPCAPPPPLTRSRSPVPHALSLAGSMLSNQDSISTSDRLAYLAEFAVSRGKDGDSRGASMMPSFAMQCDSIAEGTDSMQHGGNNDNRGASASMPYGSIAEGSDSSPHGGTTMPSFAMQHCDNDSSTMASDSMQHGGASMASRDHAIDKASASVAHGAASPGSTLPGSPSKPTHATPTIGTPASPTASAAEATPSPTNTTSTAPSPATTTTITAPPPAATTTTIRTSSASADTALADAAEPSSTSSHGLGTNLSLAQRRNQKGGGSITSGVPPGQTSSTPGLQPEAPAAAPGLPTISPATLALLPGSTAGLSTISPATLARAMTLDSPPAAPAPPLLRSPTTNRHDPTTNRRDPTTTPPPTTSTATALAAGEVTLPAPSSYSAHTLAATPPLLAQRRSARFSLSGLSATPGGGWLGRGLPGAGAGMGAGGADVSPAYVPLPCGSIRRRAPRLSHDVGADGSLLTPPGTQVPTPSGWTRAHSTLSPRLLPPSPRRLHPVLSSGREEAATDGETGAGAGVGGAERSGSASGGGRATRAGDGDERQEVGSREGDRDSEEEEEGEEGEGNQPDVVEQVLVGLVGAAAEDDDDDDDDV